MIGNWKSLSQDNKVKFIIFFLTAGLGFLGYLGNRWLESTKQIDTQAAQTQTTSGDNSPSVNDTKGNVTINYNNPASNKLPSDIDTTPHFSPQKNRDTDLRIINARLIPFRHFTYREGEGTFNDDIHIYVEVRNFGDKPIHLTSVDVDIVGNGPLKLGPGGGGGFGSDPRGNESIILDLGESKEISLSKGITMDGISEIFCEQFSDVWISKYREKEKPYLDELYATNSTNDIAQLNTILAEQFGNDAGIKLTFYSNYKNVLSQNILYLSNGTDFFSKSGRFQHDVFLGSGLVQLFDDLKRAASMRFENKPYLDMEKYIKKYRKCYGKAPQLF